MEPVTTIAGILGLIYSALKAIPIVDSWFIKFCDFYNQKEFAGIENRAIEKKVQVSLIIQKIKEAKTHDEKATLFAIFNKLDGL
jgi:hypothetical protein